jgi:M6 family metalloprotease-like protein
MLQILQQKKTDTGNRLKYRINSKIETVAKFVLSVLVSCIAIYEAYAVRAIPLPVEVTQPDGSTLVIRLHGDEFFHYTTTEDGFMVVKNAQNFYVYAQVSQLGQVLPTALIARNSNARSAADAVFLKSIDVKDEIGRYLNVAKARQQSQMQKVAQQSGLSEPQRYPLNGSPKALIILVNFKDRKFVTSNPQTAFSNLCNQEGYSVNGATGSVKDWYRASSYGKFAPDFDVFGPYDLSNDMAYYGKNDKNGSDSLPAQMILDACKLADAEVNFANYDTDGDGDIDNVFVVYAGYNEAEGGHANTVWPHRWAVQGYNSTGSRKFDGKTLLGYACTSELKGYKGQTMAAIGTFCHEFGHVLGLPDYYHTTESKDKPTLDTWNTMDAGSYCNDSRTPPLLSAYDRFFLGWLKPEQFFSGQKTLYPLSQSATAAPASGQAYLIAGSTHNLDGGNPSPKEFFIVEYRELTGWDRYLGAINYNTPRDSGGMLFWHIDYDSTAWEKNTVNNYAETSQTAANHMRVYLEPVNGLSLKQQGGAFTDGSFSSKLWNGTSLITITNITKNGTASMTFASSDATVTTLDADNITQTSAKLNCIVKEGYETVIERGFEYREEGTDDWIISTDGVLTDLKLSTKYEFRAFIEISYGTIYGNILTFKTFDILQRISVNGEPLDVSENMKYVIPCESTDDTVRIELESVAGATVSASESFSKIVVDKPQLKTVTFTVHNGSQSKTYTLTVERRFPFKKIVKVRWNNTLTVINNPAINGGYTFTAYSWYRNDVRIGNGQSWTENDDGESIDPNDVYYVELTAKGFAGTLRSCESSVSLRSMKINAYPNPVSAGQTLYIKADMDDELLKDAVIEVYNLSGTRVGQMKVAGLITPVDIKYSAGIHIFILRGKDGLRKELKIIVK